MARYTLCAADELGIGDLRQFRAGDKKILLYRLEDGFYATQHNCTHVFAPLSRGRIVEGCQIQCPFHRARFDIRTGIPTAPPCEVPMQVWKPIVQDGAIYIDADSPLQV